MSERMMQHFVLALRANSPDTIAFSGENMLTGEFRPVTNLAIGDSLTITTDYSTGGKALEIVFAVDGAGAYRLILKAYVPIGR